MTNRGNILRSMLALIISSLVLSFVFALDPRGVLAQQGSFEPPPTLPRDQHQGGGSTLEVPLTGHQQPGNSGSLPPIAPQNGQELSVAPQELRRQTGYQQVTVTVTNQHGGYQTGLQRDDFKLYVDGVQRPIDFFRHDLNTPVSVGILVDTSGSMEPKIPQARAAIAEFINQLNDRDDLFLFAFANRAFLLQPFTTNHRQVINQLRLLRAFGQTALFDTIINGLLMVRHGRWDKKALLVVTDGMDNESQAELSQVVAYARRMGVLVYSIGIGNPNSAPVAAGPFGIFAPSGDEVDSSTLNTLSTETGARTFILREVGDGVAMREDCEAISEELREQYTVGFVAPDAGRTGYRNLRVDVPTHPEDSVRVRKGVAVGSRMESASADGAP
jgi:Ca-activated chloride channel family protein